jgi:hypothetical protein
MKTVRVMMAGLSRVRASLCAFCVLIALPALCPAALEDAWNTSSCKGCHGQPISATSANERNIFLFLTEPFSTSWCLAGHAGFGTTMCAANGSYFSSPGATDLAGVFAFVVGARDTVVTGGAGANALSAFPATAFGASNTQTVTITNYRDEALQFKPSITLNGSDFSVVNNTCGLIANSPLTLSVGAATVPVADTVPTSCSITVGFGPQPSTTVPRAGTLRIDFTAYTTAQPTQRNLTLSGVADIPIYSPSGFAALTSPGFTASTDSSQTSCRTIANSSTTTAALSIALSIGQAGGASADYSNYYELDTLAACPGGSPPLCVAAGASVTGSTSVAAGSSCSLPIKFNPGKFGFAGGSGPRSALLTVTHNYPTAGQTSSYTLVGSATTGTQPQIGISTNPSAVGGKVLPAAFANQVVGTTSALWNEFLVSNTGSADGLDITQVLLGNTAEFALTENCVAAPPLARLVASSPTCTIGLTFTPLAAPAGLGQRCTNVTIRAAFSSNGDQVVQVCGTGVPVPVPQMSVTPATIPFGNRSIGGLYQPEPLVIANGAGATLFLQVGAVSIVGSGFAFVPDASSCQNKALTAGTSCTLQVQFTPAAGSAGTTYSASVTIDSNDPTTPHLVVPLTATAQAFAVPALTWQGGPTTLTFPNLVIAGQQSAQLLTVRLVNGGPGGVDVQSVRLVGADASSFSITSCPALLFDAEFCDVSVRFLPGSGGTKTAQIQVVTSTGVAPPLISVVGQGVGGSSPFLTLSANALTFGGVRVGARSDPLQVRLAAGGGVLQVTGISANGPFSVTSQTCPPVPFTLQLGSDCSVTVTFAPSTTSTTSAKLSITTDSGAGPSEIALDGAGQDQASASSGGCTTADGDPRTDPTLWLLVLLALGVLWKRRNGPRP